MRLCVYVQCVMAQVVTAGTSQNIAPSMMLISSAKHIYTQVSLARHSWYRQRCNTQYARHRLSQLAQAKNITLREINEKHVTHGAPVSFRWHGQILYLA